MNISKLLILVTSVTVLSACGSKSSTNQPNMAKAKKTSKVTKTEDGRVVFQSEQCEEVKADSLKLFCEAARNKIKADDQCKIELAISFIAEKCETEVDSSEIADYFGNPKY